MRNLKLLFAGRNQMQTIPPAIGNLSALRALTIQDTHITTLPEEFCRLHLLMYLNISNVLPEPFHLNALPACIGDLTSLCYLILHGNWLTTLPDSIGNLQNLRCLDLKFNQLSDLPASLARCQNLKWIIIENNRFTTFPIPLFTLKCAISFSGNGLPNCVSYWLNIQRFDLIAAYYARPLLDIVETLAHNGSLSVYETERLLYEPTPAIRQYLETHLPPNHPILVALAERWALEIPNDPDHHQILL